MSFALHPQYAAAIGQWSLMRDTYAGEDAVKLKGFQYLPATPGQILDGALTGVGKGFDAYKSYKMRARFYGFVLDAVRSMAGFLHSKTAQISLPPKLEYMLASATDQGETLEQLLRRVHVAQVLMGRIGLLLDVDPTTSQVYISIYPAESIINWNYEMGESNKNMLNFVALDTSAEVMNPNTFEWENVESYRVLKLEETGEASNTSVPSSEAYAELESKTVPTLKGVACPEIPFVFVNALDLVPDVGTIPLLDLAQLSVSIYRSDADYRHHLFMQSQDTLVVIGTSSRDDTLRVGAGARIDVDIGGDAKFIGVNSQGLAEERMALDNDKKIATARSIQLVQPSAANRESGSSLQRRVSAQTISLKDIAIAGAEGVAAILRIAAKWTGEDPSLVKVVPNLDFADAPIDGAELLAFMQAKQAGAPFSLHTIHDYLTRRGFTTTEFESEIAKIASEPKLGVQPAAPANPASVSGNDSGNPR